MNQFVSFEGIALSKPGVANVALVRLFPRVYPHVALEFEGVRAGVGAVAALVRALASVAPHVSLQFAQLHARIVALRTLVRLF